MSLLLLGLSAVWAGPPVAAVEDSLRRCFEGASKEAWDVAASACAEAVELDPGPATRSARRVLIDLELIQGTPAQFAAALEGYPPGDHTPFETRWLAQREGVHRVYLQELAAQELGQIADAQGLLQELALDSSALLAWRERMTLWLSLRALDLPGRWDQVREGLDVYEGLPGLWPSERARAQALRLKAQVHQANRDCRTEDVQVLLTRLELLAPLPEEDLAWVRRLEVCRAPTGASSRAMEPGAGPWAFQARVSGGGAGVQGPANGRGAGFGGAELRLERSLGGWAAWSARGRVWTLAADEEGLTPTQLWRWASLDAGLGPGLRLGRVRVDLLIGVLSLGVGAPLQTRQDLDGAGGGDVDAHQVWSQARGSLGLEPVPGVVLEVAVGVGWVSDPAWVQQGALGVSWRPPLGPQALRLGVQAQGQRLPVSLDWEGVGVRAQGQLGLTLGVDLGGVQ